MATLKRWFDDTTKRLAQVAGLAVVLACSLFAGAVIGNKFFAGGPRLLTPSVAQFL